MFRDNESVRNNRLTIHCCAQSVSQRSVILVAHKVVTHPDNPYPLNQGGGMFHLLNSGGGSESIVKQGALDSPPPCLRR